MVNKFGELSRSKIRKLLYRWLTGWRPGQNWVKIKIRSRSGHDRVNTGSRPGQHWVKTGSRPGQDRVKTRLRRGLDWLNKSGREKTTKDNRGQTRQRGSIEGGLYLSPRSMYSLKYWLDLARNGSRSAAGFCCLKLYNSCSPIYTEIDQSIN